MAKDLVKSKDGKEPPKRKGVRTADDLELIRQILEENPRLKERVLNVVERALGKRPSENESKDKRKS